ncbi:MAG: DUF6438 domain-containing protein [Vulcanimicrobiaceae bacterium]
MCLLALLLASCSTANAPDPQSITKIVLSRRICDPLCDFAQYTLYPGGRLDFTTGLRFSVHTRMPVKSYRDIVAWLVRTPAFGPRWSYLQYPNQQPATFIWTEYRGGHAQVSFPTHDGSVDFGGPVSELNRWSRFASAEAGGAVFRERQKTAQRLRRFTMLNRVVFRSNGCFGTCPGYIATFSRDGTAMMTNVRNLGAVSAVQGGNAKASVPFDKVVTLLRESNFSSLDPEYETRTVDVYGVSFEFDYSDGFSYDVQAPDRTQWPLEVAELVGAFSQLINDTSWRPTH